MILATSRLLEDLREALLTQWPQGGAWAQMHLEPLKAKGFST